jgi:hypothetical protein
VAEIAEDLNQDLLLDQFDQQKEKAEIVQVLKELFDKDKIPLITDLDDDEIRLITMIQMLGHLKNVPVYDKMVGILTSLLLSKNRKSRTEIIDAIKGYGERFRRMGQFFRPDSGMGGGGMMR